jgi:hypothetical protein
MNKIAIWAGSFLLILAVAAWAGGEERDRIFRGEISDTQCALNVHSLTRSHQEMLKSKSMGGTPTDCTLYCVNYHGGDFVLSSKNNVYRLDNQNWARPFAGRKVRVIGSLDSDKKTIHVAKIEADE